MHADIPQQNSDMTATDLQLVNDEMLVEHARTDVDAFRSDLLALQRAGVSKVHARD